MTAPRRSVDPDEHKSDAMKEADTANGEGRPDDHHDKGQDEEEHRAGDDHRDDSRR